jgi:hypothetical protein
MTPREALNEITPLCQEHPEALLALDRAVHAAETIDGKRFLYEQEKLMSKIDTWRDRYYSEKWQRECEHTEAWQKIHALEFEVVKLKAEIQDTAQDAEQEEARLRRMMGDPSDHFVGAPVTIPIPKDTDEQPGIYEVEEVGTENKPWVLMRADGKMEHILCAMCGQFFETSITDQMQCCPHCRHIVKVVR